jgi:hypothetical protein
VAWLFKLFVASGLAAGPLRARLRALIRSAGVVAVLALLTVIALVIGAAAIAVTGFIALRSSMADYQAALIVGGIFIGLAGISALAVASKVGRAFDGPQRTHFAVPTPTESRVAPDGNGIEDALSRLIVAGVQSPIVAALALGIVAGRVTKRSRRD